MWDRENHELRYKWIIVYNLYNLLNGVLVYVNYTIMIVLMALGKLYIISAERSKTTLFPKNNFTFLTPKKNKKSLV